MAVSVTVMFVCTDDTVHQMNLFHFCFVVIEIYFWFIVLQNLHSSASLTKELFFFASLVCELQAGVG